MIESGAQIRAARALFGWTRLELAEAASLHRNAVGYWESRPDIGARRREPVGVRIIREALLDAGVEVFSKPSPGVRYASED